jgi:FMN phosphatase YigB (HAD superfamily)
MPAIQEPDQVPPTRPTWVFDLDGCLIDSLTGRSLRPGARDLLDQLHWSKATLLLWSAGGAEYARERAREHGIEDLFDGFHAKDCRDGDGRYVTRQLSAPQSSIIFIDDRPEDMPIGTEVVAVHPYISPSPYDRGLHPVGRRAGLNLWVSETPATA